MVTISQKTELAVEELPTLCYGLSSVEPFFNFFDVFDRPGGQSF